MRVVFLLPLVILPLAEIAAFVIVGEAVGLPITLALVCLAAATGLLLLRFQGLVTVMRVREAIARGDPFAVELFDAACRLTAGFLLLVPGFVTDLVGLFLLTPQVRRSLRRALSGRLFGAATGRRSQPVIEGEFQEVCVRETDALTGHGLDGAPMPPRRHPGEPRR